MVALYYPGFFKTEEEMQIHAFNSYSNLNFYLLVSLILNSHYGTSQYFMLPIFGAVGFLMIKRLP
jgi:hypothetical protein